MMTLIAADGARTEDPDPATIATALRALTIENWFVILEENDDTFMQVAVKPDWFALERRAGGDETHVGAEVATIDEIIEAFQAYARQDPDWISRFTWARVRL
ncbi:hypothetical protein DFJ67_8384 [Asanoa ferruginea]|uniref:Uncharacterized protein n=1 Tax=Asanoa ferruginea TaxID=53367 RepID=A0A3E0A6X1_9ACTN|nr:hypothetical protein [Asanoa ferruginea]REG02291.1 hypothetical protein DFJ67_8384 [Asanoa ferruginea]GIF46528.1 hypothetical protein Afe04nite_10670 [Asanoa ferruginea]